MDSDPPLASYFVNNVPLPDKLVPEWTRFLDDLSASIDATEREISELESRLATAKQAQADLARKKDVAASCRSGSRRLPPEVIAQILFFSLELDILPLDRPGRLQFTDLRCVSSLWRTTAFTTPSLWRSLSVDVQEWDGNENGEEKLTELLTSWFSRAGEDGGLHLAVGSSNPRSRSEASVTLKSIASLIDQGSFVFSTLTIGRGLTHNVE
ncbi:hypothetical protein BKA70DRAFT_757879 [Coprinopsis sp. MPI-PUGE-AT-0042]|nr:hypothetical protein BKA70DRAFT_757879 [Coprinopsis sp. MPI-PUGE-AT-0042]